MVEGAVIRRMYKKVWVERLRPWVNIETDGGGENSVVFNDRILFSFSFFFFRGVVIGFCFLIS